MVYHSPWITLVYHGILFNGLLWLTMVFYGLLWLTMVYYGLLMLYISFVVPVFLPNWWIRTSWWIVIS